MRTLTNFIQSNADTPTTGLGKQPSQLVIVLLVNFSHRLKAP